MQLHFKATGQEGYQAIVQEGAGLQHVREFGVLCLPRQAKHESHTGSSEALLHIIEGSCDVATPAGNHTALGSRTSPFAGPPAALYLPPGTPYTVRALTERLEIAVTQAAAAPGSQPAALRPEDLSPKLVGRDNWQRTVTMIAPPEFGSQHLILGETINPPGNWSGVPAHKHDTLRAGVESVHEELYYFRVDRSGGWGIERIYESQGHDQVIVIEDRVVTLKPRGYHTVAAAPGFTLYYAFVLSGPAKDLVPYQDPRQAWIAG